MDGRKLLYNYLCDIRKEEKQEKLSQILSTDSSKIRNTAEAFCSSDESSMECIFTQNEI